MSNFIKIIKNLEKNNENLLNKNEILIKKEKKKLYFEILNQIKNSNIKILKENKQLNLKFNQIYEKLQKNI